MWHRRACSIALMVAAVESAVACSITQERELVAAADDADAADAAGGEGGASDSGAADDGAGTRDAAGPGDGSAGAGGASSDAGVPDAQADVVSCPASQHPCSGTCVDNTPANGCATSCTSCPVPQHGKPTCTAGSCDIECDTHCTKTGSGCDCPQPECCGSCPNGQSCDWGLCGGGTYTAVGCWSWCVMCRHQGNGAVSGNACACYPQ
jgi:hypothetical protein